MYRYATFIKVFYILNTHSVPNSSILGQGQKLENAPSLKKGHNSYFEGIKPKFNSPNQYTKYQESSLNFLRNVANEIAILF